MTGEPNVLLIVIDDMPAGMMATMPFSKAEIRDKGVIYPNGTITTPLCGPSRATLLTGKLVHNHGMWRNHQSYGGWKMLEPHEPSALPVALDTVGYKTGLFGKYMNQWNLEWDQTHTPPPGWNVFSAIMPPDGGDGAYYEYDLVGTDYPTFYDSAPSDYSTDVVSAKAAEFIAGTDPSVPFFCYYSPYGSHAAYIPAPRHVDTWTDVDDLGPAFNSDNSGRVPWLRSLPLVSEEKVRDIMKKQHEVLRSVDEGIEAIFDAIGPTRLANTLILFTGDNGLQHGEQRLMGKNIGYPKSTNVTMMARWDGQIAAGSKSPNLVTNADFTRAIVDAAGATMSGLDGLPLGTRVGGVALGGMEDTDGVHPGWIGWKNQKWLYLNYGAGQGEELYAIDTDKGALTNVASNHSAKVAEFRDKAIAAVQPLPPNFTL